MGSAWVGGCSDAKHLIKTLRRCKTIPWETVEWVNSVIEFARWQQRCACCFVVGMRLYQPSHVVSSLAFSHRVVDPLLGVKTSQTTVHFLGNYSLLLRMQWVFITSLVNNSVSRITRVNTDFFEITQTGIFTLFCFIVQLSVLGWKKCMKWRQLLAASWCSFAMKPVQCWVNESGWLSAWHVLRVLIYRRHVFCL